MATALAKQSLSDDHVRQADSPLVMTDIYDPCLNLVIWQRQLNSSVIDYVKYLTHSLNTLQLRTIIAPSEVNNWLAGMLPDADNRQRFVEDVSQLTEMYADLFALKVVGLRLSLISETMCPRFHTDRLACRLVSTYYGQGSEWLPEEDVDRSKLGSGANGLPDHCSGIYRDPHRIRQLKQGDVGLLKGDGWVNSRVKGIVHRSPHIGKAEKRLLLTLDFAD